SAFNDREQPEWPVHPARLFSALVAAHHATGQPMPDERAALQWLACLSAPAIAAGEALPRDVVPVFVPVNDTAVTWTNAVEKKDAELAQAERDLAGANDKERKAAEKAVVKARKSLEEAIARAHVSPEKPSGKDLTESLKLLPDRRGKQLRRFPSVSLDSPVQRFVWDTTEGLETHRKALARLCAQVTRVGHSSTLVEVVLDDEAPEPDWVPLEGGELTMRVAGPGQLEALEQEHERHQGTDPRILPCRFQTYGRPGDEAAPTPASPSLGFGDWVVYEVEPSPFESTQRHVDGRLALALAKAMRGAMIPRSDVAGRAILAGHAVDGTPLTSPHVGYLPLPFVGHEHADGSIKGIAVAIPRGASDEERRAIHGALWSWEKAEGSVGEATALTLTLGARGVVRIRRAEQGATSWSTGWERWTRPSRVWVTATPIVLDRFPGELGARDPAKAMAAHVEAEETIARACQNIGLPRPAHVRLLPSPHLQGSLDGRSFGRVEIGKRTRLLVHAMLAFAEEVQGPIVLGAGRYAGLGLCAPSKESA
ncbi:MAG: type I-U CRISPR-associated protein Cas5/Cas6, partial [Myxococcales bacterium]|nr:type I-U CRISPR-associated protein Cas5/Cas6 [Myxococcales bacterium]